MSELKKRATIWLVVNTIAQRFVFMLITGVLMFLCSGTLKWFNAWLYLVLFFIVMVLFILAHAKTNPDTLLQDLKHHGSDEPSDRLLIRIYTVLLFLFPVIIGLLQRFNLSLLPKWSIYFALIIIVFSTFISLRSIMENKYFESDIRIYDESTHSVVDTGPYRFVRHPGYISSILMWMATPLLFQNGYLFLFSIFCSLFFVARTIIEDKSLLKGLKGYQEYANKVHFRLIPGLW